MKRWNLREVESWKQREMTTKKGSDGWRMCLGKRDGVTQREKVLSCTTINPTQTRERERGWVALIERLIELCQMLSDILIWAAAGWHAAAHLCVCVSCRPDEIIPCSKNDLLTQSSVSGDYFLNPPSVLKTCLCEWSAYSTATHTVCMTL